jgi:hypothetical protein
MYKEIKESGGVVTVVGGSIATIREGDANCKTPRIRRWLGDSDVTTIFFPRFATKEDLRRASYFPEADVYEMADVFGGRRTFEEAFSSELKSKPDD